MEQYAMGLQSISGQHSPFMNYHGYTLIEVLIVMAIMATGTAGAAWGINSILPNLRLKSAVRDLKSDMHLARLTAVKQNTFIVSEFSTAHNSYTIYVDDGGGDTTKAHNYTLDEDEATIKTIYIHPHVNMLSAKFGAVEGKFAFNSRGAVDGLAGGVYLHSKGNNYRGLAVSRIGKLTIKASSDGSAWKSIN